MGAQSVKNAILFIDSGDTLIEEDSEVRLPGSPIVQEGKFHERADEVLSILSSQGYRMALVADGYEESFANLYTKTGVAEVFEAMIISECVGAEKPSERMFQAAMDALKLTDADKPNIYMIGNNLKRDVLGANSFGIHSILMDWSKNYSMEPESEEEMPEYRVHSAQELLELLTGKGRK
jgi:FMN phosphatase YigB (HAD superfamily)